MFWTSAFLDFAPESFVRGVTHWRRVTGYALSAARGERGEFATLVPPDGDGYLRVQRLGDGPDRVHLDLHVTDPQAEAGRAEELGARVEADLGHVVMTSPGGLTFCLVTHRASRPPAPAPWYDGHRARGHRSVVDQVCLDIPSSRYDAECRFWAALTGWELRPSPTHAEFRRLVRPAGQPLHLLLQRLGEDLGPVRAHLDLATDDRAAETRRHVALGAEVVGVFDSWTVLTAPGTPAYCLTDRSPETRVPGAGGAR